MNLLVLFFLSKIANVLAWLSILTKKGSGTSLPGWLAEKYFLWAFQDLNQVYDQVIMISGTNGKTTTRAALVNIYEAQNISICTNRGGANILRGVCTSLLLDLNWLSKPRSKVAILEVEEASLPILTRYFQPTELVLTNIFRDQLDVYGEIDKTLEYFRQTVKQIKQACTRYKSKTLNIWVNADDPRLVSECLSWNVGLEGDLSPNLKGFGLDLPDDLKPNYESNQKVVWPSYLPIYQAKNIQIKPTGTDFQIFWGQELVQVCTELSGIYNVYNTLAAGLIGLEKFGPLSTNSLASFQPVFGRGEKIQLSLNQLTLYLVKNPAGFDLVLQTLSKMYENQKLNLVVLVNDKIADGKDPSWLWDIKLELFLQTQKGGQLNSLFTGGSRGLDMLLRFQYAGQIVEPSQNFTDLDDLILNLGQKQGTTIVLCTYTALMEFRTKLGQKINLPQISEVGN